MAAAATLSLNCSDMPEVKFWACNAKMIGRSKGVGLPVLPGIMNEGDEDLEMPPKEQEHSWCCTTCTFRNHELVSRCEMCNTEKGAINMKVMVNASLTEQDHDDQWPALPDAWKLDCFFHGGSIVSLVLTGLLWKMTSTSINMHSPYPIVFSFTANQFEIKFDGMPLSGKQVSARCHRNRWSEIIVGSLTRSHLRTKCDADACSVASSWLDVAEAQHADSDEEDFVVLKEGANVKQEACSIHTTRSEERYINALSLSLSLPKGIDPL